MKNPNDVFSGSLCCIYQRERFYRESEVKEEVILEAANVNMWIRKPT